MTHLGLDFGTTNSALAVVGDDDRVALARFDGRDVFRSILSFDGDERGPDNRPKVDAGHQAIEAWLKSQGSARLVQSVKSHLASRSFTSTRIFTWAYVLEDLVALIVRRLRAAAEATMGPLPTSVVVGRPVRFVHDEEDDEGDAFAEGRLVAAIKSAGFTEVELLLEPVAAAWSQTTGPKAVGEDALVLVGDFGGGTSDFCVVELGAQARRGSSRVRSAVGVPAAGDVFDQRILERVVAPWLGKGTKHDVFGGTADVPLWLYQHLARWHRLSFLKSKRTMDLLDELVAKGHDGEALARFRRLVDEDLGVALHKAVEGAKVALTTQDAARLVFEDLDLDVEIDRADFEDWIAPDVARFAAAVDEALAKAGVRAADLDRVFLTGGTSLVPAVGRIFAERFDAAKIAGGDELTSVAVGLGVAARDRAAARGAVSSSAASSTSPSSSPSPSASRSQSSPTPSSSAVAAKTKAPRKAPTRRAPR